MEKIFIQIKNKKNPCVKSQSSFREQPVKSLGPYYKYLLRKSALHKHYSNIDKIGLFGAS